MYLDEEGAILRVGERAAAAADADAHAAREVAKAAANPSPEDSIACRLLCEGEGSGVCDLVWAFDLGLQDDGDDDAVDGHGLAEDDAAGSRQGDADAVAVSGAA